MKLQIAIQIKFVAVGDKVQMHKLVSAPASNRWDPAVIELRTARAGRVYSVKAPKIARPAWLYWSKFVALVHAA